LKIEGVCHNNLKNVSVNFPLKLFTCVTGVSGSGKSSLVTDTLLPALKNKINKSDNYVGKHKKLKGVEKIDKVIVVNESFLQAFLKQKLVVMVPADFRLMFLGEDVKLAWELALKKLKCIFCRMFMLLAKLVEVQGTIAKLLK